MKKIILSFILSFIILTMNVYSLATTATVNATAVRIRETASTEANIITNLYKDDEVEILEENGQWYKVKAGEKVGYAKAEFFNKKSETNHEVPQNTTTPASNEQTAVPNENPQNTAKELKVGETLSLQNNVKIRVLPNLSTNAKTEIKQGTKITIDAELGNWYKITDQTITGWITKSKLTTQATSSEQPPVTPQEPVPSEPKAPETPQNTAPTETVVPEQPAETPQEPKEEPKNEPKEDKKTTNKTAIVIVETARVRKAPSTKADIVDVLDEDDLVTITGEEGEFYKITSEKIGSGYISKSLVKQRNVTSRSAAEERENAVSSETKENQNQAVSQSTNSVTTGSSIVEFAKQFLGYPYVLGASSPEKGFDCSGFTRYVYGHFGYTLGQVAASQTSLGSVVERANLQVGDLLLFYDEGKTKIGHCGIFVGGGAFIHSANPQRGVVIDNLNTNSYYSQRFVTARRIAGG